MHTFAPDKSDVILLTDVFIRVRLRKTWLLNIPFS